MSNREVNSDVLVEVNSDVLVDRVAKTGAGNIRQCCAFEFCVNCTKLWQKHTKSSKFSYGDQDIS